MAIGDFFRARINPMIDTARVLAVLARRLPWAALEATLVRCFARTAPAEGEAIAE